MVRWIVGSIPHGGTIELFFVQASASYLVKTKALVILCLWDGVYKNILRC